MSTSYRGTYTGLGGTIKPFWTVNVDNQDDVLAWFTEVRASLQDAHRERIEGDQRRRDFYMGLQSLALGKEGIPRDKEGKPLDKFSRVTINQCYELIEQWVSKMTRYAPAIAVIPPNDETNDRIAAQLSKEFIDYLFYVNDIDELLESCARACRIDGETYLFIEWDPTKGDLDPAAKEAENFGIRVPLVDSQGMQVSREDGEPLYVEKAQRVGDVSYDHVLRRYVLVQPKEKWKDVEWVIKVSSCDIDELKAKHPDSAGELDGSQKGTAYAMDVFMADSQWNEVLVYEFYHKSTEFLDQGRYIKMTEDVILENKSLRENCGHDELPCVRLTNIDVPGMLHGQSFLDQLMLLQVMYNNVASIAYTNLALGAHLYWLVPAQSNVDIQKLRNQSSVIKFNGGLAPQIARFQTVGDEMFKALDFIDRAIQRTGAIQSTSRGEPPAGIEAGVALAFLEEQENQRANTDIKKHNSFIKKLARFSLATAGAFYNADDGRTIRIVGKNNLFSIKALDVAKLGGPYDIRVQRTTALSESKSGRLSQILALESRFPGKLPWEQVADMLDLANDQKFYSLATVAVQAAERENEMMANGERIPAAERYEEHLVHWYSLAKYIQSASFKEDMPEDRKQLFMEHGMSHEFWMWEKAKENPVFQAKLVQLENFPSFTSSPMQPQIPPMPVGVEPGMGGGSAEQQAGIPLPEDQAGGAPPEEGNAGEQIQEPLPSGPVPPESAPAGGPPEEL